MKIKMVDTVTQYHAIEAEVKTAIHQLLEEGTYIGGAAVKGFEQALAQELGVKHVIACANGTDALQIALMALGLEPGDEVITPTFTYVATVEVVALLKLRPVFVEVNPLTFNMDAEDLERKITPKTKAIIPVHLYGQPADMEAILEVANRHQIPVVEDCAQAIGSTYTFSKGETKTTGGIGTIGCTSFYPSKNLGAYGDGGAIMTNDDRLGEYLRMICNHGQRVKYFHDTIGVNSRLDSLQAAILAIKLKHLKEYNERRRWAASQYDALLAGNENILLPTSLQNVHHVFHQYTLRILAGREKRDALKDALAKVGIPSMIYYPLACHLQNAYTCYGYKAGDFPLSEQLTNEVISLPMHSELTSEQLQYIAENVLNLL
ncbi:MAG: DegT/DnrJ/EryC1/StrS family aminotransferase [Bacteroidia bacterium]